MGKYCVYHGTNKKAANNILETEYFYSSNKKDEWLGKGIYFYELFEKAEWWAKQNNKKDIPVIIECNFKVDKKDVVNFDIVEEKLKFLKFVEKIQEQKKDIVITEDSNNKKVRYQLLELYRKSRKQLMSINTFESTINLKYPKLGYLEFKSYEKQICLHNDNCIDYKKLKTYNI